MNDELAELGAAVEAARVALGLSKEAAARDAGISAITWKRVEDGLSVHDTKRAAVLRTVGLDMQGRPVGGAVQDDADADSLLFRRPGGLTDQQWADLKRDNRRHWEWLINEATKER